MQNNEIKAQWYWCILEDSSQEVIEPDWSRVPEAKREAVRANWRATNLSKPVTQRVKLWGPQLDFFVRQPYYTVTVLGPCEENDESDSTRI